MNQSLLKAFGLVCLFFLHAPVFASDYYWIGGKGSWSDIGHWSSSSGGIPSYTVIPGPNDNVFFDANSFSNSDTVFLPITAYCDDFDFQSTHNVEFANPGQWPSLHVNGDFKLRPGYEFKVNTFVFSSSYANQFEIEGASVTYLSLRGNGQWEFPDYATITNLYISQGKLRITADSFIIGGLSSGTWYGTYKTRIDMEGAYCRLSNFDLDNDTLITTKSIIYDLDNVYTNGASYIRMGDVHTNPFSSRCFIQPANCVINQLYLENQDLLIFPTNGRIDTLTVREGSTVEFAIGSSTVGRIEAQGTCKKPIRFIGGTITTSTVQGVMSSSINHATFRYLNFSSGIQADNSVDVIGNTGITFTGTQSYQTFYWIGGKGNYEDPSHWSLSSGGSSVSCVPKEGDTIVFDLNSFSQPDTVFHPTDIYVGGMRISSDKVYFKSQVRPQNVFYLFGNMHLSKVIPGLDSANVLFYLDENADLECKGTKLDNMILYAVGKELRLLDDTLTINKITVVNGIINLDDRSIHCSNFYIGTMQSTQVTMVNAIIRTESFSMTVGSGSLSASGSHIYVSSYFSATGTNVYLPYVDIVQASQQHPDIFINDAQFGKMRIKGFASFKNINGETDTFLIEAGSQLQSNSITGRFKVIKLFEAIGTCNSRILLKNGNFEFISSTQLLFGNVDFYDLKMFGKSGIVAANCTKMHFCSGFNVTANSVKKYWIGGQGKWHDPLNWSSQSGGSSINCIPNFNDTVVVDQNSFTSDHDTIFLDTAQIAACAYIDASTLTKHVILATNSVITLQFFYTQFGAHLSPKLHGSFGSGLIQNGSAGSRFYLNDFAGPSLTMLLEGNGTHDIYGHADSMEGLICENGETRLYQTDFKTNQLTVGTNSYNTATTNYPYARFILPAGFTLHASQITVEGVGNILGDSANLYSDRVFHDARPTPLSIKLARFVLETEADPIKKNWAYTFSGKIDARTVVLRRSILMYNNSLLKSDSFLVNGGRLVNMFSGSAIQVKDYFFAQGNNCTKVAFQGMGANTTVSSNTASFHCEHLIVQDVRAIGSASFLAGAFSQLSGNTGNWTTGSNPNLVTRIGGNALLTCADSIPIDLFPYYGSADSVQVEGERKELLSWYKDTGSFIIEAFYDNSCSIFDTLTINRMTVAKSFLPNDTLLCGTDSFLIKPTGTYASPWIKTWSNNATKDSIHVKNSGVYWMEISQPGCSFRDSIHVYLGRTFDAAMVTRDTFACLGDSIHVVLAQASNYDVAWNDQFVGHDRYLPDSGKFYYIISDSSCQSMDSILTSPIRLHLEIQGDTQFCDGDSVLLTAQTNSGSFSWVGGPAQNTYWVDQSGDYVLVRQDSGCVVSDTHNVVMILSAAIEIMGDSIFCASDSTLLQIQSNAVSWDWSDGYQPGNRWVKQEGVYRVNTNNPECNASDSILLREISLPSLTLNDTLLCSYERISIPISSFPSGSKVFVNGLAMYDSLHFSQAGDYVITLQESNCVDQDSFTLAFYPPLVYSWMDSVDFCSLENQVFSLPLDTPYAYFWNEVPVLQDKIMIPKPGYQSLRIDDPNGCSETRQVLFYPCACALYFPNAITINQDGKNETFKGEGCESVEDYHLAIYSRWGECLFESRDLNLAWDGTYKGKLCEEGVYLYMVSYTGYGEIGRPGRFHLKGTLTILR